MAFKSLGFSEKILIKNSPAWLALSVNGIIMYFPGFSLNCFVTWGKRSTESPEFPTWFWDFFRNFSSKRSLFLNLKIPKPTSSLFFSLAEYFVCNETIKVQSPSLFLSFNTILNLGLVANSCHDENLWNPPAKTLSSMFGNWFSCKSWQDTLTFTLEISRRPTLEIYR